MLAQKHQQVSIHAPTWGATPSEMHSHSRHASFNPRSHVGSDGVPAPFPLRSAVSIHAPTWGATQRVVELLAVDDVSIHAPTWGATLRRLSPEWWPHGFNPRSHVGSDVDMPKKEVKLDVSIHAPTWGATKHVLRV